MHTVKLFEFIQRATPRIRALVYSYMFGLSLKRLGYHCKLKGMEYFNLGKGILIGDFCCIEAVYKYGSRSHSPSLIINENVAFSDFCHISCVHKIYIGANCLFGSKVYVGDHNHGSMVRIKEQLHIPPALRPLDDIGEIIIEETCFICDGAIILAGTRLAAGSIVAANSVVKMKTDRPALVGGVPAKIIKEL